MYAFLSFETDSWLATMFSLFDAYSTNAEAAIQLVLTIIFPEPPDIGGSAVCPLCIRNLTSDPYQMSDKLTSTNAFTHLSILSVC